MPRSIHLRRLLPANARHGMGIGCALLLALVLWLDAGPAGPTAAPAAQAAARGEAAHRTSSPSPARRAGNGRQRARKVRHRRIPFTRTRARRAELRRQALKQPTLTLKSSFIQRAQQADLALPFTLRLRRPYEGGPGDDVLQLDWDAGAVAWPLDGTAPPAAPPSTHLDGSLTYEWDYGADTTGYAQLGTVETLIGGGISMTGAGFAVAQQDGAICTSVQSLDATGMALTSAAARFGTINPFSGEVSGTISLRTAIRTQITPCDGSPPVTVDATTTSADPPLPVAFTGRFSVSPGVSSDGRMRLGILRIDDAQMPQRTTFGLVHVCTDPTAADGCGRKAFPVRTKLLSLTADVIVGDAMDPPPSIPDTTSTTTTTSTTSPSSTSTSPVVQ